MEKTPMSGNLAQIVEMDETELATLPTHRLAALLEEHAIAKAVLNAAERRLTAALDMRYGGMAAVARKESGKDTGSVTLIADGYKVRADLPKKVEWNQQALLDAVNTIRAWNEDPQDYVTIDVKVAESKYNAWPTSIRRLFEPARTVSTGKPVYKIERNA